VKLPASLQTLTAPDALIDGSPAPCSDYGDCHELWS